VNKITIAIEAINQGKVIFFAFSDGSVEYRDRVSMAEIFNDGDLEKVWHLSQIGFSYTEDDPCMFIPLFSFKRLASRTIPKLLLTSTNTERWKS
jgi:mediator of RNA polymerase II transcription subunit 16, fungi type